MTTIKFNWPLEKAAYEARQPIQFRYPSSDWFDYDYNSTESPTFSCPVLFWRVTPEERIAA